jgi:hypothetical protein
MLDVWFWVIVEEEKARKVRGNLCAEVRGIMVWRNRVAVLVGHEICCVCRCSTFTAGCGQGSAV